ncbi:MAG TPA: hypothetical protein PK867_25490 [Pirellulales bacterium]|nr:hypothetical protein [Pirellulales bacterium]
MRRRRTDGLIKGFAWIFLAAGVLPSFSTSEQGFQNVTTLSIGVPWSPWLVYRESWSRPTIAAAPVLEYQTVVEPRCWSSAAVVVGIALLFASRFFAPAQTAPQSMPAIPRRSTVLRV